MGVDITVLPPGSDEDWDPLVSTTTPDRTKSQERIIDRRLSERATRTAAIGSEKNAMLPTMLWIEPAAVVTRSGSTSNGEKSLYELADAKQRQHADTQRGNRRDRVSQCERQHQSPNRHSERGGRGQE